MFDPRQCATSPIPAGVEIVSRKTYLRETRGRRVAQLEFNDDKDVWSGTVAGSKWTGVSVFHLSVAVTPHVMGTGKGGDSHRAEPGERLKQLGHTGIGTNTRRRKQRRSTSPGQGFEPNWSAETVT